MTIWAWVTLAVLALAIVAKLLGPVPSRRHDLGNAKDAVGSREVPTEDFRIEPAVSTVVNHSADVPELTSGLFRGDLKYKGGRGSVTFSKLNITPNEIVFSARSKVDGNTYEIHGKAARPTEKWSFFSKDLTWYLGGKADCKTQLQLEVLERGDGWCRIRGWWRDRYRNEHRGDYCFEGVLEGRWDTGLGKLGS